MACLRSAESVREFVSAVTSTEAAAGIYTLIRNSVHRYIDCYTDQCRSQYACFAFARRACWPSQQDSSNKITKNIETHLRTHFIGAPCEEDIMGDKILWKIWKILWEMEDYGRYYGRLQFLP